MIDDEYRNVFVKKLKYYMDLNNVNQIDLINEFGLSSSTISDWCTGKKLPRMGKIQMLADYFGINKSDLLEEKEETNLSDVDKKFLELFKQLTDDEKKLLMTTAESIIKTYHK